MDTILIDERDPFVVFTSGRWEAHGGAHEYNATTMWSNTTGASVTLHFSGTSVAVFGTISARNPAPVSSYQIDGGSKTTFTALVPKSIQYRQEFFQSAVLSPGRHTLLMTNQMDNGWLWLDYFEVTPIKSSSSSDTPSASATVALPNSVITPSSLSVTSSNDRFMGSTTTGVTPTFTSATISPSDSTTANPVATPPSAQSDSSSSGLPSTVHTGAIVGASVGGGLLLMFIALGFLFFWRRQKRSGVENLVASNLNKTEDDEVWHESQDMNARPYTVIASPSSSTAVNASENWSPKAELLRREQEDRPPLYTRNP